MERSSRILILLPFALPGAGIDADRRKTQALIAEIVQDEHKDEDDLTPKQESDQKDETPWHICNKYYEADVHFKISSLCFNDTSKSVPSRRKAIVSDEGVQNSPKEKSASLDQDHREEDEQLKRKVRDVFEALQQPMNPSKVHDTSHEKIKALAEEIRGVDAIMVIADSSKPLQQHRALLDAFKTQYQDAVVLSGFDLAISLVVAIPSALEDDSQGSKSIATVEQLTAVYAEEGWEYIDLEGPSEYLGHSDSDVDGEGVDDSSDATGNEKLGIERIREALETHAWPNLKRNDNHRRTEDAAKEAVLADVDLDNTDGNLERALAAIDIDSLRSDDKHASAEPTEQDEALARAFLKSVVESQLSTTTLQRLDVKKEKAPKSLEEMQQELEAFLESTDSHWPARHDAAPSPTKNSDVSAWPKLSPKSSAEGKEAFDDDFSDFVSAEDIETRQEISTGDLNSVDDIFDDGADLDFDDISLMSALDTDAANRLSALSIDEQADINLESTLSAIEAQAERVRSIKDVEKRRQEAARIALAMVQDRP